MSISNQKTDSQVREIAGTPIHLTEHGSGPRVVLVHGSAQGSEIGGEKHFAKQAELAGRGWTIITPDRPGHGQSPAPGRGDDANADAVWVDALLGESAHLVGHSFGGAVALAAAARRPEAVRSLTLIEPALHKAFANQPAVRKFVIRMIGIMLFSFSAESRIKRFCNLAGIPDSIRGGASSEEFRRMGQGLKALVLPSKEEILGNLATVRAAGIPLLLVSGGWNPAFDAVGVSAAELGGGKFVLIRSPHHFPQNVSDEFNDLLDAAMHAAER